MIKSAYILPHSPVLIPNIGRKNSAILRKSSQALLKIRSEIIEDQIETIIIISPHRKNNQSISLNGHFSFNLDFEEFGDYLSRIKLPGDLETAYRIKEELWPDFDLELKAKRRGDYGSNIPLYLLFSENNQKIKDFPGKIVIINTSRQFDLSYHRILGQKIRPIIQASQRKIALIASAELSHCLNRNAPGGFFQKAVMFDEKIIESLKKGSAGGDDVVKTDPKLALGAKECGLRPISLLLGLLEGQASSGENRVYQKELGVGYLTMKMKLD